MILAKRFNFVLFFNSYSTVQQQVGQCQASAVCISIIGKCNFGLNSRPIQFWVYTASPHKVWIHISKINENKIVPIFLYHRIYDLYTQLNDNPNLQPNWPSHFGQQSLPRSVCDRYSFGIGIGRYIGIGIIIGIGRYRFLYRQLADKQKH